MSRRKIITGILGILPAVILSRFGLVSQASANREFADRPPYGFVPPHRPCITPGRGRERIK
jgi:hypothetical protein